MIETQIYDCIELKKSLGDRKETNYGFTLDFYKPDTLDDLLFEKQQFQEQTTELLGVGGLNAVAELGREKAEKIRCPSEGTKLPPLSDKAFGFVQKMVKEAFAPQNFDQLTTLLNMQTCAQFSPQRAFLNLLDFMMLAFMIYVNFEEGYQIHFVAFLAHLEKALSGCKSDILACMETIEETRKALEQQVSARIKDYKDASLARFAVEGVPTTDQQKRARREKFIYEAPELIAKENGIDIH